MRQPRAGPARQSGAGIPPILTLVFASVVGKGKLSARTVEADKFVPKIDTIEPGATAAGAAANPAPFTVPPGGT